MMLKRNDWNLVLQSLKSDGVFLSALSSLYFMTSFVHSFSWLNLCLIVSMVFPENLLSKRFTGQYRHISIFSLKCPECSGTISDNYE